MKFTILVYLSLLFASTWAFSPVVLAATTVTSASKQSRVSAESSDTKDVVTRVVVTGATGRTGRYVVQELLRRQVPNVVAVVRDDDKAKELFPNPPSNLEIAKCDLTNDDKIQQILKDADAVIWCATGFSSQSSLLSRIKSLLGLAMKKSIDLTGLPLMGKMLATKQKENLPKVVVLSSAGVTRPTWDDEKKERYKGCADIPIVRLNPFGILDIKRESEEKLRETGVNYCIVRPCGLNDDWPAGARPVFSQGDVAVGRINRKDVASILVDVFSIPEATGKTFEVIGLAGYPKAASIIPAIQRLRLDKDGLPPDESIWATYNAMQQLLPGEKQDAAALAMGQTYEQLDQGKTGRLGERGTENAEAAAPKPT